jgi:hypothetical protein
MINGDGTGADWQNIQVTQQAPGRNSNNRVSDLIALTLHSVQSRL